MATKKTLISSNFSKLFNRVTINRCFGFVSKGIEAKFKCFYREINYVKKSVQILDLILELSYFDAQLN